MATMLSRTKDYRALVERLSAAYPAVESRLVATTVAMAADRARHVGCTPTEEIVGRLAEEYLRAKMATLPTLPPAIRPHSRRLRQPRR
ncbi:hypothetical protein GCM10010404_53850 [Nonomuraea africana]|uniref:Uncharacterized protein n=1 Tax=Nonomuraea africana TaxID=46171 RepID=A0ABR9K5M7_9ACTN|nr:hypothetical protein [Nonomuraea africana]MBE1557313.1 hypothetical protein [Nonomuraea africana]